MPSGTEKEKKVDVTIMSPGQPRTLSLQAQGQPEKRAHVRRGGGSGPRPFPGVEARFTQPVNPRLCALLARFLLV